HPHRARPGTAGNPRARAPCARQRRGADRHRHRHRHLHPDRRRGGDRIGLRDSRPWPPDSGCGPRARFPDDPGRDPVFLLHLCSHQSAHRSLVRIPRPADPILTLLHNWSVRIGGSALLVLVLLAAAAPWLGTVDPTLFDAGSRDLRPGEAGEIITLEGETVKHVFLMGSDSYGRDIYSRVMYGTRVSLV